MPAIRKAFSSLLCCFGFPPPDETASSRMLDTLQKPSTVSVHLSPTAIPHSSGKQRTRATDSDALQKIFSSTSSVRGYQAASTPLDLPSQRQSSFDIDFKFGPLESENKQASRPASRLEKIGSHIRQRMSESRLSKASSKGQHEADDAPHHNSHQVNPKSSGAESTENAMSQRSRGMLELLMSRAGSEAAYDSDARSLQSALLKGSDGTMNLSPNTGERSPNHSPTVPPDTSSPSNRLQSVYRGKKSTAKETPTSSASAKAPFITAVLAEKDTSPTTALHRLSTGISNGTIELPRFSDNHALFKVTKSDNFPSSTIDSHDQPDSDIFRAMKRLSNTVTENNRGSLISNLENPRASLVSDLDPTLIEYISSFADESPAGFVNQAPDIRTDVKTVPSLVIGGGRSDFAMAYIPERNNTSEKDLKSLQDSDQASVHLYNMRISQSLASPSVVAISSRPTTGHANISQRKRTSCESAHPSRHPSVTSTLPGRVAAEHNRRPSDPDTKRLFEDDSRTERLRSQWKTVTSFNSGISDLSLMPVPVKDDASSFYWSDGELGPGATSKTESLRRNPNSLAIGGRSESISLPIGSSSISQLSGTEEGTWFSRNEPSQVADQYRIPPKDFHSNRSASLPGPAQIMAPSSVLGREPSNTTEANEVLSEISTGQAEDARKEKMTEISADAMHDARNERLSEIPCPTSFSSSAWNFEFGRSSPSDRRRSSNVSVLSLGPRTHWQRRTTASHEANPKRIKTESQESVANMWHRSFKQAAVEPLEEPMGGFLRVPKYDRDGRRRSSQGTSQSNTDGVSALTRDNDQTDSVDNHKLARDPQRSVSTPERLKEPSTVLTENKNSKRKKGLLDIGRRLPIIGACNETQRLSGPSTPFRNTLGIWGRFPSHTKDERNGSAGDNDLVDVKDFGNKLGVENDPSPSENRPHFHSSTSRLGLYTPGSWRSLPFSKKSRSERLKSKSMSLPRSSKITPISNTRKGRRGLVGRWRRLYRSSSWELRAYTHTYGHRSSISVGESPEYPELENIPGIGLFSDFRRALNPEVDGAADSQGQDQRKIGNQNPDKSEAVLCSSEVPVWSKMYRDCIGSLSALRSDTELRSMGSNEAGHSTTANLTQVRKLPSTDLRDSTIEFEAETGKKHEEAGERLLEEIENTGQSGDEATKPGNGMG